MWDQKLDLRRPYLLSNDQENESEKSWQTNFQHGNYFLAFLEQPVFLHKQDELTTAGPHDGSKWMGGPPTNVIVILELVVIGEGIQCLCLGGDLAGSVAVGVISGYSEACLKWCAIVGEIDRTFY